MIHLVVFLGCAPNSRDGGLPVPGGSSRAGGGPDPSGNRGAGGVPAPATGLSLVEIPTVFEVG